MTRDNLLIDVHNPLLPYTSPDGVQGDALSGQVYQDAYCCLVTNPQRQLFVPIIQWINQMSVTGNDQFSLKPYMLTPAIFTESFRCTIQAWWYHGFLPKPKTSSAQNQTFKLGDNIQKLSRATASCAFFISNIILASTKCSITTGTDRIHEWGYCYMYSFCNTRHTRRLCTLWFVMPLTHHKFNAIVNPEMSVTHS